MAYEPLTNLNDWHLVHDEQDIRGWRVVDASGATTTHVDELLVNTETQLVEAVRLENGREIPAADIEIGDHLVYLMGQRPIDVEEETEPVVTVYRETRIRHRDGDMGTTGTMRTGATGAGATAAGTGTTLAGTSGTLGGTSGTRGVSDHHEVATAATLPTGFNEMNDEFRTHWQSLFSGTGRAYTFYQPAYAYGYRHAIDGADGQRDFSTAEPEIRRGYEAEHGSGTWEHVKDAVRHGYMRGLGYRATRKD